MADYPQPVPIADVLAEMDKPIAQPDVASLPLPPEDEIERDPDGLMYINSGSVLRLLYPSPTGYYWDNPQYRLDDWDAQIAKFQTYMTAHDLHYYARCKEDFFTREAGDEARKAAKAGVILDNLS